MIRGFGEATSSTYSQTLNGYVTRGYLIEPLEPMETLSGPFLVSRTGDEG
jgi:hypothetical protein